MYLTTHKMINTIKYKKKYELKNNLYFFSNLEIISSYESSFLPRAASFALVASFILMVENPFSLSLFFCAILYSFYRRYNSYISFIVINLTNVYIDVTFSTYSIDHLGVVNKNNYRRKVKCYMKQSV